MNVKVKGYTSIDAAAVCSRVLINWKGQHILIYYIMRTHHSLYIFHWVLCFFAIQIILLSENIVSQFYFNFNWVTCLKAKKIVKRQRWSHSSNLHCYFCLIRHKMQNLWITRYFRLFLKNALRAEMFKRDLRNLKCTQNSTQAVSLANSYERDS